MKTTIKTLLVLSLSSVLSVNANNINITDTVYDVDELIPSYIIPFSGETIVNSSVKMMDVRDNKNLLEVVLSLNENTTAVLIDTLTDFAGGYHESYKEYYNGIEVEGTRCTIHYDHTGNITSINGNFRTISDLNTNPSVTEDVALRSALSDIGSEKYAWEDVGIEQMLKSLKGNPNATNYPRGRLVVFAENGIISLAYKFCIKSLSPESCYVVYVDAGSGNVIGKFSTINEYSVTGLVSTLYSGQQTITSDFYSGNYRLRDYARGDGIETYKYLIDNFGYRYQLKTDYNSSFGTWSDMSTYDRAALDAHWGVEKTYDYYLNKFGRNSFDNRGGKIVSFVNDYNSSVSSYIREDTLLSFGVHYSDSTGYIHYVDLDIVAHELTHAITHLTSCYNPEGESGALNEAFSDIFAIGVVNEVKPNNGQTTWVLTPNICTGDNRKDFQNPQCKFYYGTGWKDVTDFSINGDQGGVHTNCWVLSYWFYLLAIGGSGTNEIGIDYDVEGIGFDQALRICYLMNTAYLTSNSDYVDACRCSYLAATQLGYSDVLDQIREAWVAVGVQQFLDAAISGPSELCGDRYYEIVNLPNNYSVSWNISGPNQENFIAWSHNHLCDLWVSSTLINSNAILNAVISYNNNETKTITKKIYTHSKYLSVSGMQDEYRDHNSNYYPEQTFNITATNGADGYSSNQISINADCNIHLTSPRFRGMNITFEGDNLPSNVSHTDNVVTFHTSSCGLLPLFAGGISNLRDHSLDYPLTMRVSSTDDCKNFTLNFSVSPIPYLNDADLMISVSGNTLNIFFAAFIPGLSGGGSWQLKVIKAQTGQTVISKTVTNSSTSVNISSLSYGLYIVRAIYDGNTYTAKFYK